MEVACVVTVLQGIKNCSPSSFSSWELVAARANPRQLPVALVDTFLSLVRSVGALLLYCDLILPQKWHVIERRGIDHAIDSLFIRCKKYISYTEIISLRFFFCDLPGFSDIGVGAL